MEQERPQQDTKMVDEELTKVDIPTPLLEDQNVVNELNQADENS